MDLSTKIQSSIYAGITGDALGVPVEFSPRHELSLCSVKNMLGYGRYDQPEGTWSDDTSMVLCTLESLTRGYDLNDLARTFCSWLFESRWTATGHVFDSGLTTFMALERFRSGEADARHCGCTGDDDNGNGALMRILPAALYFHGETTETFLERIHEVSAITHAHPRSKVACGIYSLLVRQLLGASEKNEAYAAAASQAQAYYGSHADFEAEMRHFDRIFSGALPHLKADDIASSGYVVDTLEASLWCFLNSHNARDILLAAVNLGLDTDTTGMVAGGLAGLYHGLDAIPAHWLTSLARKKDIDALVASFAAVVLHGQPH